MYFERKNNGNIGSIRQDSKTLLTSTNTLDEKARESNSFSSEQLVNEALNELQELEGDADSDSTSAKSQRILAHRSRDRHTHGFKVVRQSARVLTKRPVCTLTVSEAKRVFTMAVSREKPLKLADNKLFQKFCSWDLSKKKSRHHSHDQKGDESGLTSKAWVEALCAVAVYQQPCPYLSVDEALEYFLEYNLGGNRNY